MTAINDAVRRFGELVAARFATGGGEPEDLIRGPFEELLIKPCNHRRCQRRRARWGTSSR